MSNNKSIQILRSNSSYDTTSSTEKLLDGQPYISRQLNKLMFGDGTKTLAQKYTTESSIDLHPNLENSIGKYSLHIPYYEDNGDGEHFPSRAEVVEEDGYTYPSFGVALGLSNILRGQYSLVTGRLNTDEGSNNLVGGLRNSTFGNSSLTVGQGNTNEARGSICNGNTNTLTSNATFSAVFGALNTASNSGQLLFGQSNSASGANAFAGGYSSIANGSRSFAMGNCVSATGNTATAFGYNNTASHGYSFVCGINNKSGRAQQAVFGLWNTGSSTNLLEVGNGSDSARSNAFEVLKNGGFNAYGDSKISTKLTIKDICLSTDNANDFDHLYLSGNNSTSTQLHCTSIYTYALDSDTLLLRTAQSLLADSMYAATVGQLYTEDQKINDEITRATSVEESLGSGISEHVAHTDNPHQVTLSQVSEDSIYTGDIFDFGGVCTIDPTESYFWYRGMFTFSKRKATIPTGIYKTIGGANVKLLSPLSIEFQPYQNFIKAGTSAFKWYSDSSQTTFGEAYFILESEQYVSQSTYTTTTEGLLKIVFAKSNDDGITGIFSFDECEYIRCTVTHTIENSYGSTYIPLGFSRS